jgi:hypothetical protein
LTAISDPEQLRGQVDEAVRLCPAIDIHTHLFPPDFGALCHWGIDELLTYHYLVAELFRSSPISPPQFWALSQQRQADLIWKVLFVDNTPLSEATRGVATVLSALGLDPAAQDLTDARRWFASQDLRQHLDRVLKLANVSGVVMTNDPFDPVEAAVWQSGAARDPRFHAALRLDTLLHSWNESPAEARRYLDSQIERTGALYCAASFRYDFNYEDDSIGSRLLREVVFPASSDHQIPFALMIGVSRGVNPALRDAGDGVGSADIRRIERLCLAHPEVRFLVTALSRENQHELCVAARKFANLMPFGCWWFLNNPSIVAEITAERLEMLGASFIPQHSDARILEQLIYKWSHARRVIGECLTASYSELIRNGYALTSERIENDIRRMFSGNFRGWIRSGAARGA